MAGYVNDTATLAQVVGPAYAAQQAGMQAANQQEQEQLANQKLQAELPYVGPEAAARTNLTTQQGNLYGQEAQGKGLSNLFTQATQPGNIKATNAENQNKYTASQAQSIGLMGQIAGQLAGQLDNVPEAARPAFMQQFLTSKGLNPDDFGPLANGDPDMMRNFSQKAIQQSAQYQTEMMKQGQETERATGVATIGASARTAAAEASANARVQAAQLSAQVRQQQQTAEQAAVAAAKRGDTAMANQYAQLAQNLKQAQAGITGALVGQPIQPAFPGQAPGVPVQTGGEGGAPAQPTPSVPAADGQYEYRIGPDGSVQRRALSKK